MCEFPSWIEDEGQVYFLTDKDLKLPEVSALAEDCVGHAAIQKVYPNLEGMQGEGFPCPKPIAAAIHAGKMKKLMAAGGYKSIHLNRNGQLDREDGPAIERANGDKFWYRNGQLDREDGPAIERANGDKFWYLNGQCHREDGPAVEYANGDKDWYLDGQRHREDGPAVEWANGNKDWYLNGQLQEAPSIDRH